MSHHVGTENWTHTVIITTEPFLWPHPNLKKRKEKGRASAHYWVSPRCALESAHPLSPVTDNVEILFHPAQRLFRTAVNEGQSSAVMAESIQRIGTPHRWKLDFSESEVTRHGDSVPRSKFKVSLVYTVPGHPGLHRVRAFQNVIK